MFKKLSFAVIMVVTLVGGTEAALRAVMPDLEQVVSPLLYQRNSGQAFVPARSPGTRRYVAGRGRTVTNTKAGTRILVYGASAAYGEMYGPLTAFPGRAEAILRGSHPDQALEVLNLAHGGMGSRQVGEMVFRALENDDPDLIVIYSGNNEYHELRALKARSDRYDPGAELMRRRLSKSYLYRLIRNTLLPAEDTMSPPDDETWLPIGRLDVTVNQDDRDLGVALYREHLRDMVLAARERGVPLMLATVGTNTLDHLDNATPGIASTEEKEAIRALEQAAKLPEPAALVDLFPDLAAAVITEGGWHKVGHLYLQHGLDALSADALERKELAALRPMTANRNLRTTVKELGISHGVPVCDLAGALASAADNGIPGNNLFLDHCHPNAEGHRILGQALADCIADLGIGGLTTAATDTTVEGRFRVDGYHGHRPIPGYRSNPVEPDTATAEGQALAGHQAFVAGRYGDAVRWYEGALSMGGEAAALHQAIGLASLYSDDITRARAELGMAAEGGNEAARAALKAISP